ncbi:MAG TPA: Rrf2 family transcriptional regulator [Acidimicrobiales bacterium]|nr:Rrf2 family transcriptional regulator [Acidimicrobiales bacterium]
MANRRVAPPLRVTERVDYALKSLLLLSESEDRFLTTKAVAEHYGMSPKMLASVLWNLRSAEILESRPGWHGGFRLARPPQDIPLSAVIAAAASADEPAPPDMSDGGPMDRPPPGAARSGGPDQFRINSSIPELTKRTADLVDDFWQALDDHVQETLTAFTVADLARARALP